MNLSRLIALLCVVMFATTQWACGPSDTCKADADCTSQGDGYVCKESKCVKDSLSDGGDTENGTPDDTKDENPDVADTDEKQPDKTTPDNIKPETSKEGEPGDKTPDVCPPGCPPGKCGNKAPATAKKVGLGGSCTEPAKGDECTADSGCKGKKPVCAKPSAYDEKKYCFESCTKDEDCANGQLCQMSDDGKKICREEEKCDAKEGLRCIQNGIQNAGYCYRSCKADKDCDTGSGQKCLTGGLCGVQNDAGDICNYSQQAFCKQGIVCLVSDTAATAGTCYKTCNADTECPTQKGQVCRQLTSSAQKFCAEPVKDGQLCAGKACSTSSTATNCLKGLSCFEGTCVKTCKKATEKTDCDTEAGETCAFVSLSAPRICQLPGNVKKPYEECNSASKRCDDKSGLRCIAISEDKSICLKTCDSSKSDPTGANPDCPSDSICRAQQNGTALCQQKVKLDELCSGGKVCEGKAICVGLSQTEAYCLSECDPSKNVSKEDDKNPDCDSGKGRCVGLTGGRGACLPPRPKTLEAGKKCDFNGNIRAADCKEGARCVNLGGGSTCYVDCDPCTSYLDSKGEWRHKACENGKIACSPLRYSDGRFAGGVCQSRGNPVLDDGDYCDEAGKGCKEGLICVRFSNATGARPVCSKECDPAKAGSEQCASGRCGGLTAGGGVCIPAPQRRVELGEECLGDIGTDGFHDCLEKNKDGKALICARPAFDGAKRSCQVRCNPVEGIKDNTDCKAQGLNNHLCLPADTRSPTKGACLELCQFIDRLRCKTSKCQLGECQSTNLGKSGECTTQEKEDECKKQGGTCVDKTCIVSVCN